MVKLMKSGRSKLINQIANFIRKQDCRFIAEFEEILDNNGANSDDSDPKEGLYNTMSDDDLVRAYSQIKEFFLDRTRSEIVSKLDDIDTDLYGAIRYLDELAEELKEYESLPDQFTSLSNSFRDIRGKLDYIMDRI